MDHPIDLWDVRMDYQIIQKPKLLYVSVRYIYIYIYRMSEKD